MHWYPTRYDQTHNFKLSLFYEPSSRWDFAANFSYITGTPTTFPTTRFTIQDYVIPYIAGNGRNNVRIPAFHYFAQADEIPADAVAIPTQATRVAIIGSIVPAVSYNFKF